MKIKVGNGSKLYSLLLEGTSRYECLRYQES